MNDRNLPISRVSGPIKAQLPLGRQQIQNSRFIAAPDEDRPTREQKRIGREAVRRNAGIEAGAFTTGYGNQATAAIHDHAGYTMNRAAISIVGRNMAAPDFVRQYTEPFTDRLMVSLGGFIEKNVGYGSENISEIIAQSYDLPEKRGLFQRSER